MNPSEDSLRDLRQKMVKLQLESRDIKDKRVLDVFEKVPRHKFVGPKLYQDAYSDFPLPIGKGQTISQPYIVALMVQLLDVKKDDTVLEIGAGSGYETAILAELAGKVFSVERIESLAKDALKALWELMYKNFQIKVGDGSLGWPEFAPFNKIIISASAEKAPEVLLSQLNKGGRLVMPVGSRFTQTLVVIKKDVFGNITEKNICGCTFVPLIGKYGWQETTSTS